MMTTSGTPQTPTTRVCRTCGEEKLLTAEYFGFDKTNGRYRPDCKPCRNAALGRLPKRKPKAPQPPPLRALAAQLPALREPAPQFDDVLRQRAQKHYKALADAMIELALQKKDPRALKFLVERVAGRPREAPEDHGLEAYWHAILATARAADNEEGAGDGAPAEPPTDAGSPA